MNADHEFEEHESIPWSNLVAEVNQRPMLVYVAVAVMLALALGLLGARTLFRSSPPALPLEEIEAEPVAVDAANAATDPTVVTTEADLMAGFPPESVADQAAALAELFVTDYFTVDGDQDRIRAMVSHLGPGHPEPVVARRTYVEWARAWELSVAAERTHVTVWFRTITEGSEEFRRDPVRAVVVDVVETAGQLAVDGLPAPASVELMPRDQAWPPVAALPPEIARLAEAAAGDWGETVDVVGGIEVEGKWRVELVVTDESGNAWPLAVAVTGN